jgi:8-oxo-dGTP pyrophosphatase MutT (NUDIX family)
MQHFLILAASGAAISLNTIKTESYPSAKHCVPLPAVAGNAGCLVKRNGLLLAVKTVKSGKWDIPSGKPEAGETADQTAVRETLEETGIQVKAVRLLEDFDQEFYVYECQIVDENSSKTTTVLPVPSAAAHEIDAAAFIPMAKLTETNTRFPSLLSRLRTLFAALS